MLLTVASVLIFDQLSKFLIEKYFILGQSTPVLKDIFHITIVHNRGAAFGIFKNQTPVLIIISIAALILFAFFYGRSKKSGKRYRILEMSLGLIAGGSCGNLIDRIRFGYVFDFLDFRIWPVFNIADAAISTGAVILAIYLIRKRI